MRGPFHAFLKILGDGDTYEKALQQDDLNELKSMRFVSGLWSVGMLAISGLAFNSAKNDTFNAISITDTVNASPGSSMLVTEGVRLIEVGALSLEYGAGALALWASIEIGSEFIKLNRRIFEVQSQE